MKDLSQYCLADLGLIAALSITMASQTIPMIFASIFTIPTSNPVRSHLHHGPRAHLAGSRPVTLACPVASVFLLNGTANLIKCIYEVCRVTFDPFKMPLHLPCHFDRHDLYDYFDHQKGDLCRRYARQERKRDKSMLITRLGRARVKESIKETFKTFIVTSGHRLEAKASLSMLMRYCDQSLTFNETVSNG